MPDAVLLPDPAVRNMILPQIPTCDEVSWDNLTAVMSPCTFYSVRCIPQRGWESHCTGCCANEEQVPAWQHLSAERFVACWIFGEWGWEKGSGRALTLILVPVIVPSVKQASLPDNTGSRKRCLCSRMFFMVLASEKTLWDEREQENLRRSFQILFPFCPAI